MPAIRNDRLNIKISKTGLVSATDKRTGKIWSSDSFPIIKCWHVRGDRLKEVSGKDCSIKCVSSAKRKTILSFNCSEIGLTFQIEYCLSENKLELCIPISKIKEENSNFRLLNITLLPKFGAVATGEKGYMLLPNYSGVICRFDKKVSRKHSDMIYMSQSQWEDFTDMPVFGVVHKNSAFLGIITKGEFDTEVITETHKEPEKINSIYPCFHYRYSKADEIDQVDRIIRYSFLVKEEANYAGMAKTYRNYLLKERKLKPLKEKIKKNSSLKYFYNAHYINLILGGVKEYPGDGTGYQRTDGKGKFHIYSTFEETRKVIDEIKKAGIDKAILMLEYWTLEGGDGDYPAKFPVDPRLGTEKELCQLIQYAKSLGYHVNNWDNYSSAFKISPDWNPSYIIKDKDGWLVRGGIWAGGQDYIMCPQEALKFAKRDLPKMKELGFSGIWYIDAMVQPPRICYDKNHSHPVTRRVYGEGLKKITRLARKIFGGCVIENAVDFMSDSIDSIINLHISLPPFDKETELGKYFIDEFVPFYQIAYHGIIRYHFDIPRDIPEDEKGLLKEIEYGAMPRAEILYRKGATPRYAKRYYKKLFPIMKRQYKILCKELGYLQLEFIEGHKKIAPDVFETTYSDETKIIVNYGRREYRKDKYLVKPASFCVIKK